MDPKIFGNFIEQCRKECGMTQLQLGQILHVSDKTVSRWERGIGFPDISYFHFAFVGRGSASEYCRAHEQQAGSITRNNSQR